MANRPTHFEIQVPNPEEAAEFYKNVFGWTVQKWDGPEDYWLLMTGEDGEPGIHGAIMRSPDGQARTVNTLNVSNVDEYTAKVEAGGGTVVMPKMAIPGVGYVAYCKDPGGTIFGVYHEDREAK
jgi:predicted enzyme related to lactoylglutathione lyase